MSTNLIATLWADREMLRIDELSDIGLFMELHNAMTGKTYPWRRIENELQHEGTDRDILCKWNTLCDIKHIWRATFGHINLPHIQNRLRMDTVLAALKTRKIGDRGIQILILKHLRLLSAYAGLGPTAIQVPIDREESSLSHLQIERMADYVEPRWDEDDAVDEETPLLAEFRKGRGQRFWRMLGKWFFV